MTISRDLAAANSLKTGNDISPLRCLKLNKAALKSLLKFDIGAKKALGLLVCAIVNRPFSGILAISVLKLGCSVQITPRSVACTAAVALRNGRHTTATQTQLMG